MKKIMIFFILIYLFSIKSVLAQNQYKLTLQKQDGIYFSRRGENFNDDSYPYYLYKFGNIYAYCIQPGKHITTYDYEGIDNFIDLPFSDNVKEKIELIGHYGRDYPNHDNIRYSMATQALIWELTGVDKVSFWTEQYEKGEEIDVSKEKNEIMDLVRRHQTTPNIEKSITGIINKEINIIDSNKVLNDYEVVKSRNNEVEIYDNTLRIIPKTIGEETITLKHKAYDTSSTIIFVGKANSDSQILGRFRFSTNREMNINLKVNGVKIRVNKVDENNERISIPNIKFKIKNLSNDSYLCENELCEYETDNSGIFTTNYLEYGEYEISEVENQVIPGYVWNKNKTKIIINENTEYKLENNDGYIDINFVNKKFKGFLTIHKLGEKIKSNNNKIDYEMTDLANVEFEIYKGNELYKTIITDSLGYAKIGDLPAGTYKVIEKNTMNNYISNDEEQTFTISQVNQYEESINVNLEFNNYLKKGRLEFIKEDFYEGIGIPDTIIELYNEKDTLLLTSKTNEKGKIVIENLPYGKYYIKEIEANYFYQKEDNKKYFEIKENNEIVRLKMTNKKIVSDLEIYKKGEKYSVIGNEVFYEKDNLGNIEFSLYSNNNELITLFKIDKNGYYKYSDLPLGKYYLIEKTKLNNYITNSEKIFFEIKKDGNIGIPVVLEINNYLKKGDLEFSKIDLDTTDGISDTIIEIYDESNKLLITKKTDENGKIIVNNLPYGKYYIIEKEANSMYQLTNEKVPFEIKENGEKVKAKMTNEKIAVKVPKTKTKEGIIVNFLFGISLLIGFGRGYYERKKIN